MISNKLKIVYNTSSSFILQLLTIVTGFVLPNFYLRYYGAENYGLVVSITQYLSLISLCDLGVGAVIQAAIYKPYHDNDNKKLSSIYVTSQQFFKRIAYLLIVYIIILIFIFPQISDSKIDWSYSSVLIIVLSIKLFLQYYFGITNRLFLQSAQYIYIINISSSISLIVNLVVSIILIIQDLELSIVLFVSSIIFIIQPLSFSFFIKKKFNIDKNVPADNKSIPQKWNGMAQHFATIILENSPTIILTILCPLTSVAIYALYHMVTNGIKLAFTSIFQSFLPFLGGLVVNNDKNKLHNFFNAFCWFIISFSILIFTITAITIVPFLKVYTLKLADSSIYLNYSLGILMSVAACLYIIRLPFNYLIQAFGHFKQTQNSAVIEVLINLIITIVAIELWGIVGTAIGMSVALCYRIWYFVNYAKKLVNFKFLFLSKILIVNIISTFIIYGISYCITFESISYIEWICKTSIVSAYSILISLICNYFVFKNQIKIVVSRLIKK